MLRIASFVILILTAVPAFGAPVGADPLAHLDQPSQTVTLERAGTQMMAFYSGGGDVLDLTILITDPEGDALRTRIGMRDRQHHTLLLPGLDDDTAGTRIEFLRTGDRIEMVIDGEIGTDRTDLADNGFSYRF